MKWTNPKLGDKRTLRKFLFFPCTIDKETR